MTDRILMDDIQYRLKVAKKQLTEGRVEDGKLLELQQDCAGLRRKDPGGPYVEALLFIEGMLSLVRNNLSMVSALRTLGGLDAE